MNKRLVANFDAGLKLKGFKANELKIESCQVMFHVIDKMYSGRSDEQKTKLAEEITKEAFMKVSGNQKTLRSLKFALIKST